MPRDAAPRTPPRSADPRLRAAMLMPLAALLVHQGRYYLAFGAHTPARLLRDGHSYLGSVIPFAVLAAALALGALAGYAARAWQGANAADSDPTSGNRRADGTLRVWALCALILLVLYCAQELTEGALAASHAGGVAGIVGSGGWLALPLAIVIGGLTALVLRAGDALVRLLARLRTRRARDGGLAAARPRPLSRHDWRLSPASGISAGRAPPLRFGRR